MENITLFAPDQSYDNPALYPGLSEEHATEAYRRDLEKQFTDLSEYSSLRFKLDRQANIGMGADFPAFAIEVLPHLKIVGLVSLFLLGKRVNESLDGWIAAGTKLIDALRRIGGYLNRAGAAMIAVAKTSVIVPSPSSIQLLQYVRIDDRLVDDWREITIEPEGKIDSNGPEESISTDVHVFRIKIDDQEFLTIVRGSDAIARPINDKHKY